MPTNFFTNSEDNSLIKKFEGTLINNPGLRFFDALVGYFRASGYFKVRPFLEQIPKIRILVGINVDLLTKQYHEKGLLYLDSSEETKETFLNEIIENIQKADYNKATEDGINQFLQDIISEKIEMRAHPTLKIHAKVYIFKSAVFNEYAPCEVITGSSNLTDSGLGTNINSNYEFNVSLKNYDDVKFASDEFEKLWEKSVPILHAEAQKIKDKTYLKDDFTPFELYIKMLIEYFGKRVEYDPYNIDLLLPDKFTRLKYQSDAANQGYAIMMKHNGIILADVVGLGKTIIACMIAKKFIYENGTHTRILIVLPPALVAGWKTTTEDFQIKNHFEFVTTGSLDKITNKENLEYSNADKFDMIIIDEAHKFRNDYTEMYRILQEICKIPRSRPSENGDTRKKVMLLSATPLNNRPQDIENQLYLFQDRRNSTLENIRNLQEYFKPVNELYKRLSAEETLNIPALKRLFQQLRYDIIEPLVIRRTRTDIENNPEYLEDLKTQNVIFPKVGDPIPLFYQMKGSLSNLFFDTVSLITGLDENGNQVEGLGYYRYRAIEFLVNEDDRRIYGNVGLISNRLSAIMRTLLVKRLESSFHSFKKSLIRLQTALQNMLTMFDNNRIFIAPDLDINKLLAEGYSYDEIEEKINQKGGNNKEFLKDSFSPEFYKHLLNDKAQIDILVERWETVKSDPKLTEFINQLKEVFFNPEKNYSGKLVIFTEAKETAEELAERVSKTGRRKPLLISSDNRKDMESIIRLNFDANIDEDKWKDDYNILITTEVLAEGVNLHRSNIVVNYDVPWNSTRLMQRIGRVNRIGSRAENIYVYNFYPSSHGDAQIQLVDTALRKLQSFHTAFGEDNKIFSLLEEKSEGGLCNPKIKEEESEILKYLNELRDFKKKNQKRFIEISKIPNKARCGREAGEKTVTLIDTQGDDFQYNLKNGSIAYLKSKNHPGVFCFVTPTSNIKELNFLQAVKVFKAIESEKAVELHTQHHEQTLNAFDFYVSDIKQDEIQQNVKEIKLRNASIAEKKAIANLYFLAKNVSDEKGKKILRTCINLIYQGTFSSKGLPKTINSYFSTNIIDTKNIQTYFDHFYNDVLSKFDIPEPNKVEKINHEISKRKIIEPQIVITISFK